MFISVSFWETLFSVLAFGVSASPSPAPLETGLMPLISEFLARGVERQQWTPKYSLSEVVVELFLGWCISLLGLL